MEKYRVKNLKSKILIVIAISLILAGGINLKDWYTTRHNRSLPPPDSIITYSTQTPGEGKIDILENKFKVADALPRIITIPELNIETYIQQVGVDQYKRIAVPSNIYLTGWFIDSAKPGESGVSIIDGHMGGRYEKGIFKELDKLSVDDKFYITYGDGRDVYFQVKEVKTVSIDEAEEVLYKKLDNIDKQLNLITCGGEYNKQSGYDKRVIVIAQMVE
jgi:LPXTG-site transpeptidase (sortase) family protein